LLLFHSLGVSRHGFSPHDPFNYNSLAHSPAPLFRAYYARPRGFKRYHFSFSLFWRVPSHTHTHTTDTYLYIYKLTFSLRSFFLFTFIEGHFLFNASIAYTWWHSCAVYIYMLQPYILYIVHCDSVAI